MSKGESATAVEGGSFVVRLVGSADAQDSKLTLLLVDCWRCGSLRDGACGHYAESGGNEGERDAAHVGLEGLCL